MNEKAAGIYSGQVTGTNERAPKTNKEFFPGLLILSHSRWMRGRGFGVGLQQISRCVYGRVA